MFKIGDRVVCVNDNYYDDILKKDKIYIIDNLNSDGSMVSLYNLNDYFFARRFILLKEYRKEKLEKINKYV